MCTGACEYLAWDSQFFGFRIGRLGDHSLTSESAAEAQHWAQANRIDCLYFLAGSDDPQTVSVAQNSGFELVDIRITLDRNVDGPREGTTAVRPFQRQDEAALRTMARLSHRDSRFYFDGRFPKERCDALYETWIRRSLEGWADAVFVADCGAPAGYISCHLGSPGTGSIGLFAVGPEYQHRGLGGQLITAALEYFRKNGVQRVTVVTQGRNTAAQRAYQRNGFLTQSVQLWYHRWFNTDSPV
jgi:dTDP-4-amino-4,6-dideoxy-D-galactose acyltransferase